MLDNSLLEKSQSDRIRQLMPLLVAIAVVSAGVIFWPQLSSATGNDFQRFETPCDALTRSLFEAKSGEDAAQKAEHLGVSANLSLPADFEASSVLCWDSHDGGGNGKIEGVAVTNADSSSLWLVFGDDGTKDPDFWASILEGYRMSGAERTAYGFSSDPTASGAQDFWDKAVAALGDLSAP